MKIKKFAAALLAALMLAGAATTAVQAEDVVVSESVTVEDDGEMSSDELFEAYFMQQTLEHFGASIWATDLGSEVFERDSADYRIYEHLKKEIVSITRTGGSTKILIPDNLYPVVSVPCNSESWPSSPSPTDPTDPAYIAYMEKTQALSDRLFAELEKKVNLGEIIYCLLADCPYELYWFSKTSYQFGSSMTWDGTTATMKSLTIYLPVISRYQANNDSFMLSNQVADVQPAIQEAARVVDLYKDKSTMYKLYGYRDYICDAVSYNNAAVGTTYGDPWQLIYVFDKNPDTNVVCEGYAKAFQYLCELSNFENDDISCYIMTGTTNENHMWNVVSLNGINYLVDVTNSEDGNNWCGQLFMNASLEGSVNDGYTYNNITYRYDQETINLYNTQDKYLQLGKISGSQEYSDFNLKGITSIDRPIRITLTINDVEQAFVSTTLNRTTFPSIPYADDSQYSITISAEGYASYKTDLQSISKSNSITVPKLRLLGDIDGDNDVDKSDLQAILAHLRGETDKKLTGYNYTCADLDQNGIVNARDCILMMRHLAN